MINPQNIQQIETNGDEYNVLTLEVIPEYDIEDYDIMDDKDFQKYISDIEKVVRSSFEYRTLINYLRENMDMNKCSFFENVNNIDTFKIKIHIHHHPLTLGDISLIIYKKRATLRESLEIEAVAKEVMYVHYCLMIGLIPLCETVHELVHNKYLFVPTDKVLGNYRTFVDMYKEYMEPEQIDTLEKIEEYTEKYNYEESTQILNRNYIYIDLIGVFKFPKLEDIVDNLEHKIKQLKENNYKVLASPITFIDKE